MTPKYEIALQSAKKSKTRTRKVYDLLVLADKEGDGRATYALATWYLFGTKFTPKDLVYGTELLKRAEREGVADAVHDLAVSYEKGVVVGKSAAKAFVLYVKAALLGDKQSFYEVGRMYYHGIGVRQNRELAEIWLDKAESLGIRK